MTRDHDGWVAQPEHTDEVIAANTGRRWDQWREVIDAWAGRTWA